MEPLESFADHPSLKFDPIDRIYLWNNGFYLATPKELVAIQIDRISYTNMGEPYRDLVRIEYTTYFKLGSGSIDVDFKSGARLLLYCQSTDYTIDVDSRLLNHQRLASYLEVEDKN